MELTLLGLNKQGVLKEGPEHRLDVVDMFLPGLGKDTDVIQVDEDKLVEHVPEEVVDQGLEDGPVGDGW